MAGLLVLHIHQTDGMSEVLKITTIFICKNCDRHNKPLRLYTISVNTRFRDASIAHTVFP